MRWYTTRAATVPSVMPPNTSPPTTSWGSAIAMIRPAPAVMRFTVLEKSTRFCTQMRTPIMPIIP